MAVLADDKVVVVEEKEAASLSEKSYGEVDKDKLYLSPEEAVYLVEKEKLQVEKGKKKLGFKELVSHFSGLEEDFLRKYVVFKDLRDRGFVVRSGFKFGAHFRMYERGVKVGEGHAAYLVHVVTEQHQFTMQDLSRAIRLSQNVRKKMIWACVDKENCITYYKTERVKL